jgi:hypothetical protein
VVISGGVTLLVLGAIAVQRYRDRGAPATVSTALAPSSEFPREPEMRRAWELLWGVESTQEDYALAENLVNVARAARPTDPK